MRIAKSAGKTKLVISKNEWKKIAQTMQQPKNNQNKNNDSDRIFEHNGNLFKMIQEIKTFQRELDNIMHNSMIYGPLEKILSKYNFQENDKNRIEREIKSFPDVIKELDYFLRDLNNCKMSSQFSPSLEKEFYDICYAYKHFKAYNIYPDTLINKLYTDLFNISLYHDDGEAIFW